MRKIILAAIALILLIALIGVVCVAILAMRKSQRLPAWITLPDGTSVRIVAVTYGTNHVIGTKLGQNVASLPVGVQNILKRILGHRATPQQTITTPTPELLVWLDHQTNSSGAPIPMGGYCEAILGDGSNFISGSQVYVNDPLPFLFPWQIQPVQFEPFPRREPTINLNFFYHTPQGKVSLCATLPFANPLYHKYPDWQPEALPKTKVAGDLEVTLRKVETGHDNNMTARAGRDGNQEAIYGTNRADGRNNTFVDVQLRCLGDVNDVWKVAGLEISDASGNRARNGSMSWSGEMATFAFTPSLWPGEAWKLKLDVKRTEGFKPGELIVFKDVSLGELNETNTVDRTTNSSGVSITLRSICRRAPLTNNSWSSSQLSEVKLTSSTLPADTYLDLVSVVWNPGKTNLSESVSWSDTERTYGFREVPLVAKMADFVFVLQKGRTVEFTVKPELPQPESKSKERK